MNSLLFRIFFALLWVIIPSASPAAGLKVDVIREGDSLAIQIPPLDGASGNEATKILRNDLENSGWFRVVESGGDYVLRGTAGSSGVQCKIAKTGGGEVLTLSGSGKLRGAVHQVADELVAKLTGHKGFAKTHIAFISDKSGKKELYAMDYDGYHVQRLTSDAANVLSPNFSKQGNRLAFTSFRSGYPDVYVAAYPSGSRSVVARYPGLNSGAAFSPSGNRLALTLSKDGNPELYTMSVSGGDLKRLTRTAKGESSPTWSPDGSQIAYVSDEGGRPQIYVISSSGGTGRRITSSPAYNTEPDWSIESGKIACSSSSGGTFSITVMEADGSGASTLCAGEHPSWSPNGRHLVFSRSEGHQSNLYLLDTLTKRVIQLTRNFGNCTQPTWSGR